ncbi:uncharacterized protein LOC136080889 [Hydra vulgaris]|uniref:Uncharacterized protein LOC136080889 n=1 Tax=Hydra vulgaris TaxID=6087 RepID=A0ABM4BYN4_HYDVU
MYVEIALLSCYNLFILVKDLLSLMTEDQLHDLFKAFVLAFNSLKESDYVFKILVPESIVFIFGKASNVSRIKAEVALCTFISERQYKLLYFYFIFLSTNLPLLVITTHLFFFF